jgi:hypothetical protein
MRVASKSAFSERHSHLIHRTESADHPAPCNENPGGMRHRIEVRSNLRQLSPDNGPAFAKSAAVVECTADTIPRALLF